MERSSLGLGADERVATEYLYSDKHTHSHTPQYIVVIIQVCSPSKVILYHLIMWPSTFSFTFDDVITCAISCAPKTKVLSCCSEVE